jgi:hypothetical protein
MFKNSTIELDIDGKPTMTDAKMAIDLTEGLARDALRIGKNGFMIGTLISPI